MDLTELRDKIIKVFTGEIEQLQHVLELVDHDNAIFPFNEYEYLICNLIEAGGFTYEHYIDIRTEYISRNPNLWIFEISAPRSFGEKFAQTYVQGKCAELVRPSKKNDKTFKGEYDLRLDDIRIEVKASRVVDANSDQPLYAKALSRGTNKSFLMNFQQLKPQYCDVFIWVAVFRDEIILWILGSQDVAEHALFSKGQHRGNKGNEGQLHIKESNIGTLDPYELKNQDLAAVIRVAARHSAR